jgi:hypothetical protein
MRYLGFVLHAYSLNPRRYALELLGDDVLLRSSSYTTTRGTRYLVPEFTSVTHELPPALVFEVMPIFCNHNRFVSLFIAPHQQTVHVQLLDYKRDPMKFSNSSHSDVWSTFPSLGDSRTPY